MKNYIKLLSTNRSFLLIMLSDLLSNAGDILFTIALSWTVLERTKSILLTSILFILKYLSQSFCSIFSGLLADRFSRKKLLIISMLSQAFILFPFMILIRMDYTKYLCIIFPILFILYLFSTLAKHTQNVMIPDIVSKDDLVTANSVDIILNRVVGVGMLAVAGFLTSVLKITTIVFIDIITFLIPAGLLYFFLPDVKLNENLNITREDPCKNKWLQELKEGWQYICSDTFVFNFLFLLVFLNFPYSIMNIFPLAYVNKVLNGPASSYGIIKSVIFASTLLSMYVIGSNKIFSERSATFFSVGLLGSGFVMLFFSPIFSNTIVTASILFFIYNFFDTLTQPLFINLRGRIPSSVRGRVLGIFDAIVVFVIPVFTFVGGFIMDNLDIRKVAIIVSIFLLFFGVYSIKLKLIE
ncbi:hypothetical protein BBF96_12825 [Anoxybacter fermentans]|uniref:Major facilitator superfamily (MFS) profile domain-containing protein n=1 Tax=Anoxybacter fermentans TaxID=1323375 RepID=A0A3S9T0W1_9FIRM|nr:MFS transporter [Anoxybacter fermentans]AZR74204.1 hypothetical protein BBF96_12825 [Anoxybacter fermentans]